MTDINRQKRLKKEISNTTPITKFEQLPNELILACWTYLNFYKIYEIFYCLNQRFNQLIPYETKIHLDLSSIPSRQFLTFCFQLKQFIITSQHYPSSIRADDKHKLNLILEDDLFTETFSKLKSLTLSEMDTGTIYSMIFDYPTKLYQSLKRLTLLDWVKEDYFGLGSDRAKLCRDLISSEMKSLTYLNLNFVPYYHGEDCGWFGRSDYVYLEFDEFIAEDRSLSNLEILIIGDNSSCKYIQLCFNKLSEKLLPYLPKLKHLLINAIYFNSRYYPGRERILPSTEETNPNIPLNLKVIKIKADYDWHNPGDEEKIIRFLKNFFMNNNTPDTTTIKIFHINRVNVLYKTKL